MCTVALIDGQLVCLEDNFQAEGNLQEEETQFRTDGGAEFSVFSDDEFEGHVRIEISPNFIWGKEDVWQLVNNLLTKIGEIDEEGNLIGEHAEKPLFVVTYPGKLSDEDARTVLGNAEILLKKANIDAVPFIAMDGLKVHFDKL